MAVRRLAALLSCVATSVAAQQQETVVVTATRLPQAGFDIPASIDALEGRVLREDTPQVNLSESLNRIPGIVVQNRQNYAQDLQISSRGFGARSTFGVRGVRLLADGIPATMPDGQGQAASFDLASAERIEVLRGPFAALYGNSSGGVVQIFTADGPEVPTVDLDLMGGSFGQRRAAMRFGGTTGDWNWMANASRFHTDGSRAHSAATREQANAKVRWSLGAHGTLTLVANTFNQPLSQDPLGLTRAQFEADPHQVDASALQFDTRKTIRQSQAGLVYALEASSVDRLELRAYGGTRRVIQSLGQSGDTPLGAGGVVDLDRGYGGVGLRWTRKLAAWSFVAGADADRLDEKRHGFVNDNGKQGALRRDEDDVVRNVDAFVQATWDATAALSLSGGVRTSQVEFTSADRYITATNPDDSGRIRFQKTLPVAGVLFKASERVHLYASAGQGFETPTFAELAYRPGGVTGINFDLKPARSSQVEAGVKTRLPGGARINAAAFTIETRDEIVTNTSAGGRTDFRNASRTRRDGLEASAAWTLAGSVEGTLAWTALRARFTEAFSAGGVAIPSGRFLPGVPNQVLQGELAWRPGHGFHAAIEGRRSGRVYVNEANVDAASGYSVVNLRAGQEWRLAGRKISAFVRVDNATDRRYAGSVIVAEARGRYFEPAAGRAVFGGLATSFP